jgi:hypothetical protein
MYKNFLFYFNNIIYINYEVCTYDDQLLQHFHDRPYYVHVLWFEGAWQGGISGVDFFLRAGNILIAGAVFVV